MTEICPPPRVLQTEQALSDALQVLLPLGENACYYGGQVLLGHAA